MEKEKAEIARLVEKYGRIQSLMKYVNSDTLKDPTANSERKSGRNRRDNKGRIRGKSRGKYRKSISQNEEVFL